MIKTTMNRNKYIYICILVYTFACVCVYVLCVSIIIRKYFGIRKYCRIHIPSINKRVYKYETYR